jgi:hypothetical protein
LAGGGSKRSGELTDGGGDGGSAARVTRGGERRCLNRAHGRDVAVTVKIPPYHGVRTGIAADGPPRARRTYSATAGSGRGISGAVSSWEGAWPRVVCDLGRRGVRRRVGARARPTRFVLLTRCLNMIYFKNLNTSGQNFEYKNCRSSNPLSLSQWL